MTTADSAAGQGARRLPATAFGILSLVAFGHLINDMLQAVVPALYPLFRRDFHLDFGQIGLITFAFQLTASIFQPLVGFYADLRPRPYSTVVGMLFTLSGLAVLAYAPNYLTIIVAVSLVGFGSAIFHPESSRLARAASGGRYGLAQSIFQTGGNIGTACGPLLAALIVVPFGQHTVVWFTGFAAIGAVILARVGGWYMENRPAPSPGKAAAGLGFGHGRVMGALFVLGLLIFSKFFYMASITSYYTLYLIDHFHVGVETAQLYLFLFLASVAAGTIFGGPIGDRFGRKVIIWLSILGTFPFAILLPHADLFWTAVLSVFIGAILSSGFSGIIVYAQELVPGKVGTVSGLFFGFAFGMGGLGAAALGKLADATSIEYVYQVCAFLPLIGLLTIFLPDVTAKRRGAAA